MFSNFPSLLFWIGVFPLPTFLFTASQTISSTDRTNGKSGVYALPEISLKLGNGTVLEAEANSPVKLSQEIVSVVLTCTADYPVRWEYLRKNKTIPVLDVVYRRVIRNISDFDNPKRNRFMSVITLRGLLESQTGKYLCRQYNEKLNNNSYAVSTYFDLFIPGNRTFNAISTISFANKTASYVDIHCPVTDPDLRVTLYKLNDQHFNKTGTVVWKSIYANYEPTHGFKLLAGLGRELTGTYNCTSGNGASLISLVADPSEREHYQSLSPHILVTENSSLCGENYKFVQYTRSRRLECYCKDSFGLFMNDNYEFENRQANCSTRGRTSLLSRVSKCSDWRLDEFIRNQEESQDVCFRQSETRLQLGDGDGTGSRPSLKVKGKSFANGDHLRKFPFTKFTITYNGFVDWAGDFMLAVCRKKHCLFENNDNRSISYRSIDNMDSLEFVEKEPTRKYFPLAHHQAVWNDLIINGTDIAVVYVLQAHSLSYAWFPYATAKIEWDEDLESVSLGNMDRAPADTGKYMTSTSSCSSFWVSKITSYNYYTLSSLTLLFMLFLVL